MPNAHASALRAGQRRGFTLVEMMIVVAIVGILAVLAVVGYRRMIVNSHTSEATHLVSAIRVAQEAYHAETQTYASPSSGLAPPALYPIATPTNSKTGWGGACGWCGGAQTWQALPVHSDGAVMYGYATMGGPAPNVTVVAPACNATAMLTLPVTSPTDWYVVTAFGDTDANGKYSCVIGDSWTNDIFTYFDSE